MSRLSAVLRADEEFAAAWVALLALLLVLVTHRSTGYAASLIPLYILPLWLGVHLGTHRVSAGVAVATAVVFTFVQWQLGLGAGPMAAAFAASLASLGIVALLMISVEERLRESRTMAEQDPLTGLLNRRSFLDNASKMMEEQGVDRVIAVAIDCDHFKELNDAYGHGAGDQVLQILSQVLTSQTREGDLVARVGGDEFVLVLQDVDMPTAKLVVGRIGSEFEARVRAAGYPCTISSGIAAPRDEEPTVQSLMRIADEAMYADKASKRCRAYLN